MSNDSLFDDFGTVDTVKEFGALQIVNPKVDHQYLSCAALNWFLPEKQWLEELWVQYKGKEDKNFLPDLRVQFPQRAWELYLGVTLINQGFSLDRRRKKWPDFVASGKDRKVYIEAICPTKGDKDDPNKVPDMGAETWGVPEEKILLRLTNALDVKCRFVPRGFSLPYVIAINRGELQWPDMDLPYAAKALYGIGGAVISIPIGGSFEEATESHAERQYVDKANGAQVGTAFFFDPKNAGVSAVLYCWDSVLDCPREKDEMGSNFFIFHNPLATHKIPVGYFHFAKEEWGPTDASGGFVGRVRY